MKGQAEVYIMGLIGSPRQRFVISGTMKSDGLCMGKLS